MVFQALKDHRAFVRTTAAECINECIRMINARDYQNDRKKDYLEQIYNEVSKALQIDSSNNSTSMTDINYQQSNLSILAELIQVKPG